MFEGQKADKYSIRAVQTIFKDALKKANIQKNVLYTP